MKIRLITLAMLLTASMFSQPATAATASGSFTVALTIEYDCHGSKANGALQFACDGGVEPGVSTKTATQVFPLPSVRVPGSSWTLRDAATDDGTRVMVVEY